MNHQLLVNGKGYTAYFTKKCSEINIILEYCNIISTEGALRRPRVAEVAREHRWPPPKSLDSDENFKPEHALFCRELRLVAIYALFEDLWAKNAFLGQKQCFLGKKCTMTWYTMHILMS